MATDTCATPVRFSALRSAVASGRTAECPASSSSSARASLSGTSSVQLVRRK